MQYLLSFSAQEFVNFRELEVRSLLDLNGLDQDCIAPDVDWNEPYILVNCQNDEQANKLIERSVLIKSIYSIWAQASTFEELLDKINLVPKKLMEPFISGPAPIKVNVTSVNKKTTQEDRLGYINRLLDTHKDITAPISLKSPEYQLYLLFDYTRSLTNQKDQKLKRVFYGRLVGESSRRRLMSKFDLSKRTYLGNTTMDVRLAGIIANACLARRGDVVWDPFLGTGGMVLATSVWGAYGAGCDIDYALVHGKGRSPKAGQGKRMEGECLRANYRQYGLQSYYLDVIIADAATLGRLLRVPEERLLLTTALPSAADVNRGQGQSQASSVGLFDAIITDPPYGVRERSCRIAGKATEREPSFVTPDFLEEITGGAHHPVVVNQDGLVPVTHDLPHFPHKEVYPLQESFSNLLTISVRLLKPQGRLVFWVPVDRNTYSGPESLPSHPRLKLITVCEQALNNRVSRFLMVMEKLHSSEADFNLTSARSSEAGDSVSPESWGKGVPFHLDNFRDAYFKPKKTQSE
ncbi:tRNA methyltransferase 11 [Sparganum proliferum]